ncbi:MAG: hypothetical protein KIT10_14480 [Flavobacteriales bacterium]|nr:hypothetical protein [Flavobacteriales bacterium]
MVVLEGTYLLEFADLVNDRCLSKPAYDKGVREGRITICQRGSGGRPALIDWKSLAPKYQELVAAHLGGDPEHIAKAQLVERHLVLTPEDERHIEGFKSSNGLGLSPEKRRELKKAAAIMNLVATLDQVMKEGGSRAVQAEFGMTVMALKETILAYIKANRERLPKKFPTSFARLEARKRAYLAAKAEGQPGAATLIHGGQGNANSSKLGDDQRKALLMVCSRHQNYSLQRNATDYNRIAAAKGWPTISANTVRRFLADGNNGRAASIYAKGIAQYSNNYGIVVHRSRPTQPTYMWVHDGTDYELLYRKEEGGKVTHHHRKLVVVVVDPHTWYPVGYAIGDQDTIALAQEAVANAVLHMKELTGSYALPYQVQSDRLGHKTLGEWYERMGVKYTPAAARNSRSKIVEPWFKHHNDTYVNRNYNWSGHNVTSRSENQPSPEALNSLRKHFPDEHGVIAQIHEAIAAERADKVAAYRQALEAMPAGTLRAIGREQYLELFGVQHKWENELTNRGLCPTILGEERPYQLLSTAFQREVGARFRITYDPQDLSTVLATSMDGLRRYLVPEVMPMPMALMDHTPETRAQLAATESFKKELSQAAIDSILNNREQMAYLAEQLLLDASLVRRPRAGSKTDDVMRMTPEQEAVEKNYIMIKGSHKAAQQHVRNYSEAEIQQRAVDNL